MKYPAEVLSNSVEEDIAKLWKDPQIQEAWEKRSEYYVNDTAK